MCRLRGFSDRSVFFPKKPHFPTKAYKLINLHKIQKNLDKYKQDYISRWSNDLAISPNRRASITRWSGELANHLNRLGFLTDDLGIFFHRPVSTAIIRPADCSYPGGLNFTMCYLRGNSDRSEFLQKKKHIFILKRANGEIYMKFKIISININRTLK